MRCPMCSGGGMVMTSMGPKPCPNCGGGGVIYSESDYEEESGYENSSYDVGSGSGGSSSDYDYDSSSYDDDRSYSPAPSRKGSLSFGKIILISAGIAFLGFVVAGKSGLWAGAAAFFWFVVYSK